MARQAHSYFAGAVSSTAVIVAAVIAFVLLVSAQAFREWPVSGLGFGGPTAVSVSSGRAVGDAAASHARVAAAMRTAGAVVGSVGARATGHSRVAQRPGGLSGETPGTTAPRGGSGSTAGGGGSASPASPSSTPAPGGGSGSHPAGGGGGAGVGGADSGVEGVSTGLTSTVGNTVSKVNETLGGALSETGAPDITQGVVNGAAGPSSSVGHAVDETPGAVGGLLHVLR